MDKLIPAIEGSLLVQLPPIVASLKIVFLPTQTVVVPVIGAATGLTSMVAVVAHPMPEVYVAVAIPPDTPVTIPEAEPMVAINVLLIAQLPGPAASVNVPVEPTHTFVAPDIGAGAGATVTIKVAEQEPTIYDITDVPALTPVTTPSVPTVATDVVALDQLPPVAASVRLVVDPLQMSGLPLIGGRPALTVTVVV